MLNTQGDALVKLRSVGKYTRTQIKRAKKALK